MWQWGNLSRKQGLGSRDYLPDAACSDAFSKGCLWLINGRFAGGLRECGGLGVVDKSSIRGADNQLGGLFAHQLGKDLSRPSRRVLLLREIAPRIDRLDGDLAFPAEKERYSPFA